jgi:hypothetical protein
LRGPGGPACRQRRVRCAACTARLSTPHTTFSPILFAPARIALLQIATGASVWLLRLPPASSLAGDASAAPPAADASGLAAPARSHSPLHRPIGISTSGGDGLTGSSGKCSSSGGCGLPASLTSLLLDAGIVKAGVAVGEDVKRLEREHGARVRAGAPRAACRVAIHMHVRGGVAFLHTPAKDAAPRAGVRGRGRAADGGAGGALRLPGARHGAGRRPGHFRACLWRWRQQRRRRRWLGGFGGVAVGAGGGQGPSAERLVGFRAVVRAGPYGWLDAAVEVQAQGAEAHGCSLQCADAIVSGCNMLPVKVAHAHAGDRALLVAWFGRCLAGGPQSCHGRTTRVCRSCMRLKTRGCLVSCCWRCITGVLLLRYLIVGLRAAREAASAHLSSQVCSCCCSCAAGAVLLRSWCGRPSSPHMRPHSTPAVELPAGWLRQEEMITRCAACLCAPYPRQGHYGALRHRSRGASAAPCAAARGRRGHRRRRSQRRCFKPRRSRNSERQRRSAVPRGLHAALRRHL